MNAVVIVAHPDDELIWCGGLLLAKPHWDWTVLSLCRADDANRAPKFRRVCRLLGAAALISDLDDGAPLAPIHPPRDIGLRIRAHVADRRWGRVFTHGANGEYGHRRHREIYHEVLRLVGSGVLRCDDLWTFAYSHQSDTGHCTGRQDADIEIPLKADHLAEKARIVRDIYGYANDSFEVTACISPECFDRPKIWRIGS